MRSGYVYPSNYLYGAGYSGYHWSGRAFSSTSAYYLLFDSSGVYPSNNGRRYNGRSVRCVAGWE